MSQQLARLVKTTVIYGLGQVLIRFISLLLLPLFTTYLTPTEYGISAVLGLLAVVLAPIFSIGLGTAIGTVYFHPDDPERRNKTIWTAFAILGLSGLLLGLLGIAFGRGISELALQTPDYQWLVTMSVWCISLATAATPLQLYLQLEERAISYAVITVVVALFSIALSISLVVVLRQGIWGLVEANLVSQALAFVLFLLLAARRLKPRLDLSLGQTLVRTGVPLIPGFAFLFIILQANKYLLQWFDGLDALGVYSIGFNIGMVMNLVVVAFTTAWTPYFLAFSDRQDEARRLFGKIFTYYVFAFGALNLIFYFAAKPLVMLMTDPDFHNAFVVVGPSATSQFLLGVFSLLLPAMYFAQEVPFVTGIQAAATVVAALANLLLIPPFGIAGAAAALAIGALALVVAQLVWNLKRRRDYFGIAYEWNRVLKFALIALLYIVPFVWNRSLPLQGEALLSAAAALTLPSVLYLLLSRTERDAIWRLVNHWVLRRGLGERVGSDLKVT